ncbi:hypothetical protein Nepgr_013550 [Nepenthes gracilis]|uniref:Uncharacterized protein n=1 Tax=Nepenthes gracilis TaxID=150966 RepID=A0AAD3SJ39_NEPGR|nr:hypothetical protein Nepgr_013550 [Nepenthes gracilis]
MLVQRFSNIHQQKQRPAQRTNGEQCVSNSSRQIKNSSPQQNPSRKAEGQTALIIPSKKHANIEHATARQKIKTGSQEQDPDKKNPSSMF